MDVSEHRREASRAGRGRPGRASTAPAGPSEAVVWHELECGSYCADMELWRELARAGDGPVLEIGAGVGRVALELARDAHRVTALERDGALLEVLRARARRLGLEGLETLRADARAFTPAPGAFALCIVPMQTLQLLGGAQGRRAFLTRARTSLRSGGLLACAIVTDVQPFGYGPRPRGAEPEIARVGDLTYVSRAVRVRVTARAVRIERERRVLAGGASVGLVRSLRTGAPWPPWAEGSERAVEHDVVELARVEVEQLQREGERAGLVAAGTRAIAPSGRYTGSVVVMFGA